MNFASDNTAGIAPEILAAIARANEGAALAYGNDAWTRRVEARFAEIFEHEVAVFLVPTGTAANALALAHLTPPWGAVLCHAEAHIATDECGAPEFFGGGIKLIGLAGEAGKIAPATLQPRSTHGQWGGPHHVSPAVLSLSQATEAGTIYRPDEIAAPRRDRARARACRACRRRAVRQCARAHECIAGAGDLEGGRRCALLRRHQGRRARRRGRAVLRSGARRQHAGAAQARRPSRLQAPLHRRADRGLSRRRSAGSGSRATPMPWPTGWRDGLAGRRPRAGLAGRGERGVRRAAARGSTSGSRRRARATIPGRREALPNGTALPRDATLVRLVTSFATTADEVDRFVAMARCVPDDAPMPKECQSDAPFAAIVAARDVARAARSDESQIGESCLETEDRTLRGLLARRFGLRPHASGAGGRAAVPPTIPARLCRTGTAAARGRAPSCARPGSSR